ncbi:MAG: GFA family protein [Alphaproteobacteria bacterium]|nr:GFA family protein [Alphaproteobacteria bacterium]MBV9373301.1 GFA family protein [Alphaproteobacteria bacterium]MBV9900792.1 GFA family protein [Alphaproteobacteria bacterium]
MDENWKLPWEGGCRCGRVRLRVTQPPLLSGACHCTGCRRMSASAFSLTLTLPASGLEVTAGEPVIGGLHGPVSRHHHCPHCLAWLFTRAEGFDWFVNLRAPTLDDHGWVVPYVELWTDEKLPWAETPARHAYPAGADAADWQRLMDGYAREGVRPGGLSRA